MDMKKLGIMFILLVLCLGLVSGKGDATTGDTCQMKTVSWNDFQTSEKDICMELKLKPIVETGAYLPVVKDDKVIFEQAVKDVTFAQGCTEVQLLTDFDFSNLSNCKTTLDKCCCEIQSQCTSFLEIIEKYFEDLDLCVLKIDRGLDECFSDLISKLSDVCTVRSSPEPIPRISEVAKIKPRCNSQEVIKAALQGKGSSLKNVDVKLVGEKEQKAEFVTNFLESLRSSASGFFNVQEDGTDPFFAPRFTTPSYAGPPLVDLGAGVGFIGREGEWSYTAYVGFKGGVGSGSPGASLTIYNTQPVYNSKGQRTVDLLTSAQKSLIESYRAVVVSGNVDQLTAAQRSQLLKFYKITQKSQQLPGSGTSQGSPGFFAKLGKKSNFGAGTVQKSVPTLDSTKRESTTVTDKIPIKTDSKFRASRAATKEKRIEENKEEIKKIIELFSIEDK